MKKIVCVAVSLLLIQLQAGAVILEFKSIQADQSVQKVINLDAEQASAYKTIFYVYKERPESGPVCERLQLKGYEWSLTHQVDVDEDGLLDIVMIELSIQANAALSQNFPGSFSVGDHIGIANGQQLEVIVESVRYTLATGETGLGVFKGFSEITVVDPSGVQLNGNKYPDARKHHLVHLKSNQLKIEPLEQQQYLPAVAGISFVVEADTDFLSRRRQELNLIELGSNDKNEAPSS